MSPTTLSLQYFSHNNLFNPLNSHSDSPENQSAAERDAHTKHLATMAERSRLARELHDSVTQSLYSLTLMAEGWRRMAKDGEALDTVNVLTELGQLGQQALKEARLLVYELRPPVLEEEGLIGALKQRLSMVEKRAGVQAQLLADSELELLPEQEEELYWLAQEALSNSLKHSGADQIRIRLTMSQKSHFMDNSSTDMDRVSPESIVTERVSPGRVFAALAQPALRLPALARFGDIALPDASNHKMSDNQYHPTDDGQKYESAGHRWGDKQRAKHMGATNAEHDEAMHQKTKKLEDSNRSYGKPRFDAANHNSADKYLVLEIEDNGCGLDTQMFDLRGADNLETDLGGMGLLSMHERAAKLNGILTISSACGKGTRIQLVVPLPSSRDVNTAKG